MPTTFRFKLNPNKATLEQLIDWQGKTRYVKNRMIGDREFTYHRHFVMGDYCALHNRQTYTVSALRSDLTLKETQSIKQGKKHVVIPAHHTSQECSECHHVDASGRDGEKYICSECGYFGDADNNAGNNIGNKGIELEGLSSSKVRLVRPEFTPQIRLRRYHPHGRVEPRNQSSKVNDLKTGCLRSDPIDSKAIA